MYQTSHYSYLTQLRWSWSSLYRREWLRDWEWWWCELSECDGSGGNMTLYVATTNDHIDLQSTTHCHLIFVFLCLVHRRILLQQHFEILYTTWYTNASTIPNCSTGTDSFELILHIRISANEDILQWNTVSRIWYRHYSGIMYSNPICEQCHFPSTQSWGNTKAC